LPQFLLLGAVAFDTAACADVAADILQRGGSAVDSAIAGMICSGAVHPQASGIGGGAFMVIRLNNGSVFVLNSRETAPLEADENMFNGNATLKRLVCTADFLAV
jgi:gamma-glutamyltranspeptidase/glutathione hydrolase/leukotriene-C4 hydrolase